MRRKRTGITREHKVQLVLGLIAVVGVLGAAVISNVDKFTRKAEADAAATSATSPSSTIVDFEIADKIRRSDYIALLDIRAERVVRILEHACKLLQSYRRLRKVLQMLTMQR